MADIEPGKSYMAGDFAFDWTDGKHSCIPGTKSGWMVFRLSSANAVGDYDEDQLPQMLRDFPELTQAVEVS